LPDSESVIVIENDINVDDAWTYAALSEMAYRRANQDFALNLRQLSDATTLDHFQDAFVTQQGNRVSEVSHV